MKHILIMMFSLALSMPIAEAAAKKKHPYPECRCQNYGNYYKVGEEACIKTNKGPRMARCILKINVSFWEWLDRPCPVSNYTPVDLPLKLAS
ncbi:hypothetical protein [Coralliovum pocilloporae]|uniref:hypothetical protein n=1 Tax=Coralliovum pocilloporae TaxID=3066369 RepID=UPI0033072882